MLEQREIKIREFKKADLAEVKNLIDRTIDACYRGVYCIEAVQFFKDWHCSDNILTDAAAGRTVVAEQDRQVIGTGTIVGNEIKRVFVEPGFQNRGFGKRIMRALEKHAISTGIDVIKLDASLPSKKFYDLLDYITLEKTFRDVENNKHLDFYRMEKRLINR
jgi:GNAT superfamily N-acetyltransferase